MYLCFGSYGACLVGFQNLFQGSPVVDGIPRKERRTSRPEGWDMLLAGRNLAEVVRRLEDRVLQGLDSVQYLVLTNWLPESMIDMAPISPN